MLQNIFICQWLKYLVMRCDRCRGKCGGSMYELSNIDQGRAIDWGRTSEDYGAYRPGPPDSFYQKLKVLALV